MTGLSNVNAVCQALRVSTCLANSDHQRIVISSLYSIYNSEPYETGQLKMGEVYESLYDDKKNLLWNRNCPNRTFREYEFY
jgi:hypothetical protein